ncbi:MAG: protease inhibitor I42 family protein [Chloroflexi bacterium]|nr:protease inhibitor I42 family protein [Chloroflexota bacterium]
MKRMWFFLIVAILLVVFLISCAPEPTAEPAKLVPDKTDPSQPIIARAGATFDIVLDANPSTGYHWELVEELDAHVVELVGNEYAAQEPIMPGSGGVDVWTFRAVDAGDTTIVFGYYPPNPNADPQETLTFNIRVE